MEIWFAMFLYGCPLEFLVSVIVMYRAKLNHRLYSYCSDRLRTECIVLTNSDRTINWPMIAIEVLNLTWAIIGCILNSTLS